MEITLDDDHTIVCSDTVNPTDAVTDAAGNADRVGARIKIFTIPLIGVLAFLSNGALGWLLHNRERVASYLLWGGSLLVQLLVWVAGVGILRQM